MTKTSPVSLVPRGRKVRHVKRNETYRPSATLDAGRALSTT
ncbi:hypothetical protein [Streptomyces mutabilis]|nr:hypothetical protein [Streptomyces mutabilis]